MSKTQVFLEKRLEIKEINFLVDKLSQALELTDDDETTFDEQRILEGIVNFGNTDTREVMCPRMDMFAFRMTFNGRNYSHYFGARFSRIPVFTEKKDTIKGILICERLITQYSQKKLSMAKLLKHPFMFQKTKN